MSIAETLAARLNRETAEKIERANDETTRVIQAAGAYDEHATAASYTGAAPKYIHATTKLYGAGVHLSWDDCTPEAMLELMRAFPAVPTCYHWDGNYKRLRPLSTLQRTKETDTVRDIDGYLFHIDGGWSYGTSPRLEWYAELAGRVLVSITAKLKQIHNVTPHIAARTVEAAGHVVRVESCDLVQPMPFARTVESIKYGRDPNSLAFDHWVLFGNGGEIRQGVEAWAAECLKRGQHSRAAYLAAKATPESVPAEPRDRDAGTPYRSRSLRSGTERQTLALETPDALADMALAKRHWDEYKTDRDKIPEACPVKPSEFNKCGFEHYVWACAYLFRIGILDDSEAPTKSGKPYRYGSAWL